MTRRLHLMLMFVIAAMLGLVLASVMDPKHRALIGQNDFTGLYLGGKLAGTPQLYSAEAQYAGHGRLFGLLTPDPVMPSVLFSRPPFYGWILKPLAQLPYYTAYLIFQLLSIATLCAFLWRTGPRQNELFLLAPMFPPLVATIVAGQDIAFVLGLALASLYAARKGWDFAAGLILSLCAIKLHLFVLIPLAVLFNRRFRIAAGAWCGGLILVALSLAGNGFDVIERYIALLRNPVLHPARDIMPNIAGLATAAGGGTLLRFLLAGAIALLAAWLMWRSRNYEQAFGYALVGGILLNTHSYMHDCLLLLAAWVILGVGQRSRIAIGLLTLAITPIPHIMLQQGPPWSAVLPLLLIAALGSSAVNLHARGERTEPLPPGPVSSTAH